MNDRGQGFAAYFAYAGKLPLPGLPFTAQQLAELATDSRFHLD